MKKLQLALALQALILIAMLTAGCASNSANSYPSGVARTSFDVEYGEVLSTRVVEIEGEVSDLGRWGGAFIGYAIGMGNSPWYANTNAIQSAVAGVGGAVAGEAIERKARSEDGLEIVVRLDRNHTIAVVQAMDLEFNPGDRVQVLMGRDGSTRVHPI